MIKTPVKAKGPGRGPQGFSSTSYASQAKSSVATPRPPAFAPSLTPESSRGGSSRWRAYAQGGVREDDASMMRKAREGSVRSHGLASSPSQAQHSRVESRPQPDKKPRHTATVPEPSSAGLLDMSLTGEISTPDQSQNADLHESTCKGLYVTNTLEPRDIALSRPLCYLRITFFASSCGT